MPLRLAHPVWIEDPNFDLDFHVRRAALPSPGGPPELEDFLGQVVALPLDRTRPLWELYLVEGLEGGLQAVVVKMHHAAIDGVSGAELSANWLDLEPDPPISTETDDWQSEPVPGEVDLAVAAWAQLVSSPLNAARAARRLVETALYITEQHRDLGPMSPPLPFSAPRTSLNLAITAHRRVALGEVTLADLKVVKNHFKCTVNDVVLALCAGALRRYLTERGDLPEEPLVGFVPISVRAEGDLSTGGNHLSATLTSLATDVADPLERLHLISALMSEAKSQHSLIGADALTDWTEFTFPALIGSASHLISSLRVFDRVSPAFNVTISNIPGPTFPLLPGGCPCDRYLPPRPGGRGCRPEYDCHELLRRRVRRAQRMQGCGSGPRQAAQLDRRELGGAFGGCPAPAKVPLRSAAVRRRERLGKIDCYTRTWLSGRASPCQGEGRGFESRRPLQRSAAQGPAKGP